MADSPAVTQQSAPQQSANVDTSGWTDQPSSTAGVQSPSGIAPAATKSAAQAQPPSVDTTGWKDETPVSQQGSQSPDAHPLLHGAFNLAEDIAYPLVGAAAGGTLGAVGGGPAAPATGLAGAALGGMAGEELKRAVRQTTGRGNLNPTGAGHVAEDLTAGAGGGAQEFSTFQKAAGQIIPKVLEDAKAMGIDLTPGTTGGKLLGVIEGYLRTAPKTAATINQTVDKVTNQSILAKGSDLADSIAKASLEKDPQVLGNTIAEAGQQVKNQATAGYNQAVRSAQKLNAPANSQQAIEAAEQFRANVSDNMSASIVRRLMANESPENAAKYLLANGSSLSNAQALTAAIGTKGQGVVSGAVLKELLDQSTNEANQTLKPATLMAKWNDLGPAAQQALFPNQAHRDAVQTFLNVMDRYAQPINTVSGPSRNGPAGLITASAIGAGGVGALMHPYIGVPIAATGLAVHFAPQILLKVLQNPTMAQNLSKAVTSPAGSYAQRGAVQMLTQFAQRVSKTISPPTPPSGQDQQQ
jgi:hypothetical protein